jgi:hypothetical protein
MYAWVDDYQFQLDMLTLWDSPAGGVNAANRRHERAHALVAKRGFLKIFGYFRESILNLVAESPPEKTGLPAAVKRLREQLLLYKQTAQLLWSLVVVPASRTVDSAKDRGTVRSLALRGLYRVYGMHAQLIGDPTLRYPWIEGVYTLAGQRRSVAPRLWLEYAGELGLEADFGTGRLVPFDSLMIGGGIAAG